MKGYPRQRIQRYIQIIEDHRSNLAEIIRKNRIYFARREEPRQTAIHNLLKILKQLQQVSDVKNKTRENRSRAG